MAYLLLLLLVTLCAVVRLALDLRARLDVREGLRPPPLARRGRSVRAT
jgi:hypothetical protein